MLGIFLLVLLLVAASRPVNADILTPLRKNAGPGEGPDRTPPIEKYCGDDAKKYCTEASNVFVLYCLYENKDQLSEGCQAYLGSTTIGGCNSAAMTYCAEAESVPEITQCLFNHSEALSDDCLRNLQNSQDATNPLVAEQEEFLRATMVAAVLASVFLTIPCLALLWAMHEWFLLYEEQKTVLGMSLDYLRSHSEVLRLVRAADRMAEDNRAGHSWTLSFNRLSYWTEERESLLGGQRAQTKQILHSVSGECRAQTMTAVMGPSGSGKTTLLKLLGGQTFGGQFAGQRAINSMVFPAAQYDEIMRRQGFVPQGDHLLANLTVWQTLLFAAMLRLPNEMDRHRKLCRAAYVMHDLGLGSAAQVTVGGAGQKKGISGGQRRRLSIALEVLANPSTLLLDEPTSGLDAASTLRIVQTLRKMTRQHATTVVLTIHQPRAEVFGLFDSLILLGQGGYLVYCGLGAEAVSVLSAAPCLMDRDCSHTNPGDFIIDILGLADSSEDTTEEATSLAGSLDSSSHQLLESTPEEVEDAVPESSTTAMSTGGEQTSALALRDYFQSTAAHSEMSSRLTAMSSSSCASSDGDGIEMSPLHGRTHSVSVLGDGWDSIHNPTNRLRWRLERAPYPASFATQVSTLAARRALAFLPSAYELAAFCAQISAVCGIVCATFSYAVASELEAPYQVLMLLSIVSLYLMIIQYLQLIPEYMNERTIIVTEIGAKYVRSAAYLLSAVVTEVPRAMLQTLLLMFILYAVHPLNPNTVNIFYSVVCTMLGLYAWQGLISLCAVATDAIAVAYSMLFLVLGSGTLFGGLLVRYSKLPAVFRPLYYLSVAAVTQRALISNDLRCCYLTATCNSIAHDLDASQQTHSSHLATAALNLSLVEGSGVTFCPPGLEFTGDGSDLGNLGRIFLVGLDMQQEHPLLSVLFLLVAAVVFRSAAIAVLAMREASKAKLREVPALD